MCLLHYLDGASLQGAEEDSWPDVYLGGCGDSCNMAGVPATGSEETAQWESDAEERCLPDSDVILWQNQRLTRQEVEMIRDALSEMNKNSAVIELGIDQLIQETVSDTMSDMDLEDIRKEN